MTRAVSELAKHFQLYGLSYEEACVIDVALKEEDYRTSSFQLEP
ncbi:hypothetical protein [Flavobacterium branchiophilum]|nr:hypothetical protein [Flavobacterium branchiophilum]